MQRYILELIVFLSGAVVMILEMVGSRVLAPFLGTSIIVWTSLIGVILGSLSLGYWWGGKLADKGANFLTFGFILLVSSILILGVAIFKLPVLGFSISMVDSLYTSSVFVAFALFAAPAITLGMVSPYAVRLKLKNMETSGATVGNLYAISTVGSIAGTFLAGFVLVAYFGVTTILFVLALVMFFLSILCVPTAFKKARIIIVLIILGGIGVDRAWAGYLASEGMRQFDTKYNHVVIEEGNLYGEKPVRLLKIATEWSSAMYLNSDELVFPYTRYYRLARHFNPNIKRALMIGGGAYSFPKDFLRQNPKATMDVVEIDPKLTELAREYFRLEDNLRLKIIHEDARTFLNVKPKRVMYVQAPMPIYYDAIYGDAFKSHSPPYQLTTEEALNLMKSKLSKDGVLIINVISSITGDNGRFLRAEYATLRSVFPQVYVLPVTNPNDPDLIQNIMLVALNSNEPPAWESNDPELNEYLSHRYTGEIALDMPILTDEYAPVENYLIGVGEELGRR